MVREIAGLTDELSAAVPAVRVEDQQADSAEAPIAILRSHHGRLWIWLVKPKDKDAFEDALGCCNPPVREGKPW